MVQTSINMFVTFTEDNYFYRSLGEKRYELSNHLGNVLSVISDRRLAFDSDANGTTNYYEADVMSAQDYDPFGMLLVGRSWEVGTGYKYGFNGKEGDDEISGTKINWDFGSRVYNATIGRWLSVDVKANRYPFIQPYNFVANCPIWFIDPAGEDIVVYYEKDGTKYILITVQTEKTGEVIVNADILPLDFKKIVESPIWSPPTVNGSRLDDLNDNMWGNFKSDAKMLSFVGSASALLSVTVELDIITINPNSESIDAGETHVYFTVGGGFGVGVENLVGLISWDLGMLKGNVEYNEDNNQGIELDYETFTGWAYSRAGSALLFEKSIVQSYGACWEGCMTCIVTNDCDEDLVYSAELKGVSLSQAATAKPSAGGQIVSTHSWHLGELKVLEDTSKSKEPKTTY